MLGGSTGINNMAWTRASRAEYDAWESFGPNNGWNWDGMLPHLKQPVDVAPNRTGLPLVDFEMYEPTFEGFSGPVSVSFERGVFEFPEKVSVRLLSTLGIRTCFHHTWPQPILRGSHRTWIRYVV